MKKLLRKEIKTTEHEVFEYVCDLCRETTSSREGNWSTKRYHVDDIEVQRVHGSIYPEMGQQDVENFHVCPSCWETKLVPWFREQGAQPTKDERCY